MSSTVPPAHLWRARCRANLHAGFGGRDGETGQFERPAPRSVPTLLVSCSYGFRPKRRAHDAISEIQYLASHPRNYQWVFETDIKACFDEISHTALMDRLRVRIKDKRVCALVKAFLKSGVFTELGGREDTITGTPQGGILSPLLANIALSVLDEHFAQQWQTEMGGEYQRSKRKRNGQGNWKLIRYADLC